MIQNYKISKVWTNGIPYEKSYKKDYKPIIKEVIVEPSIIAEEPTEDPQNPVCQNLNFQLNSHETLFSRNDLGNRREESYYKIAEREKQIQVSRNPFFLDTNYITDIGNQDKFMKPQNTNLEK